ncbi:MAG: YlxR family protein [Lachnospiraceae bacterium]|nr:YlxR family protein [Lachnospiraceae bacterium]
MGTKNTPRTRKIPMRQCTGCGVRKEKKELIRIIKTPEDLIEVDFTGKKNGRGAYICNSVECLRTAEKRKSLERSLKVTIPAEVYKELEKEMMGSEK